MLADILQTCFTQIASGATIEDCLVAYPQQRGELEAPLRTAARIHALPRPALPAATRAALAARMLTLAARRRAAPAPSAALNSQTPQPVPGGAPSPVALLVARVALVAFSLLFA